MERTPNNELFTTAEILIATGLGRGTITNRAKKLGIPRTGRGYNFEQIMKMVTLGSSRADKQKALDLRERLNNTFAEECWPLKISVTRNTARLEQYDASKYLKNDAPEE